MIFLSLGTTKQPFPRAVGLMKPFLDAGEPVTIQYGLSTPDHGLPNVTWVKFMDHEEFVATVLSSDKFFVHAGVGSVITALTNNVTPVVIARMARFGEHVDDHQVDLAQRLSARGLVVDLPYGDEDVVGAAARAREIRVDATIRGRRLFEAVGATIAEAGPPSGGRAQATTPHLVRDHH